MVSQVQIEVGKKREGCIQPQSTLFYKPKVADASKWPEVLIPSNKVLGNPIFQQYRRELPTKRNLACERKVNKGGIIRPSSFKEYKGYSWRHVYDL